MLVLVRDNGGAGLQMPQGFEFAVAQVPPSLRRDLLRVDAAGALQRSHIPDALDAFEDFDDGMSSF